MLFTAVLCRYYYLRLPINLNFLMREPNLFIHFSDENAENCIIHYFKNAKTGTIHLRNATADNTDWKHLLHDLSLQFSLALVIVSEHLAKALGIELTENGCRLFGILFEQNNRETLEAHGWKWKQLDARIASLRSVSP